MIKLFDRAIKYFLLTIIFIFPFFFLSVTQEFFLTNKLYLISFGSLFLLLISTIKFVFTKKFSWEKRNFDNLLILFLVTLLISIIVASPNKIQAILNPNFGLLTFFSLTILYFYISRASFNLYLFIPIYTLLLSILTIIFFFQPFKNIDLPGYLQFLKKPSFTPIGSQLDLAIFLGFFLVYELITQILEKKIIKISKQSIFKFLILTFNILALSITLYSLLKPNPNNSNQLPLISTNLPPFRLSWYAAVEILKNPMTAFFGVGIDNFSSIFTRVKDIAYNQSPIWQIFSFNYSRSSILHIFTETGIFGLLSFSLVIFQMIKLAIKEKKLLFSIGYLLLVIFLFPPSLIIWFLLFLMIAESSRKDKINHLSSSTNEIDLANLIPFYIITTITSIIFIAAVSYLLTRSYLSEIYFKKALDGMVKNNAKETYDNMRQAIILNPYIENYRINFSQLNLLLANNIASKVNQNKDNQKTQKLSEQDRQNISQAIQAAINEGKAAITLNPQKALNWENLAQIYRNIINTTQGADVWTISAYQRAIVADPQNPIYRINLGGVYYSLGNYDEATKIFEQAVILKPDWPNAYYNLAWANYQKQNYQAAVSAMENVTRLLDPKKDKVDYDKAKKELEEFKKKLPKEENQTSSETNTKPQLTLPSPIPTDQPKIELPKEASPEAQ